MIDRSGSVSNPPITHKQICVDVAIAVIAAAELLPMLLIGLLFIGRHFIDRRRMRAWNSEWRTIGPQWSRHQT